MDAYWIILLIVHIGGAIVGIGPTFAFSILGPNVGKFGPNGGAAVLKSMIEIQRKLVAPVALVTQPLSGALLIFKTGRNDGFFEREWLWIAIILFAFILYAGFIVDAPRQRRMAAWMDSGTPGPPPAEIQRDIKGAERLGPILGMTAVIIIILMIWKPGDLG